METKMKIKECCETCKDGYRHGNGMSFCVAENGNFRSFDAPDINRI